MGWESAVVGSAGGFSEDLTDGGGVAFKVVTAVFVKKGCCEGMHGRVREHGAPAMVRALVREWRRRAGA